MNHLLDSDILNLLSIVHSYIASLNHVCGGHLVNGLRKYSSLPCGAPQCIISVTLKGLGRAYLGAFVQGPTVS